MKRREQNSYKDYWSQPNKNSNLYSLVIITKSSCKRNVLILSTMEPIFGVANNDPKKTQQYTNCMTLQKEGQMWSIKELRITHSRPNHKDGPYDELCICAEFLPCKCKDDLRNESFQRPQKSKLI